ncbi:MAG: alpha/beta fold hydrolase [Scrofimicrobium sp.]
MSRRALSPLTLIIAAVVALGGCSNPAEDQTDMADFYAQPSEVLDDAPGSVIKSEPITGHTFEAKAWRVMYRTTDLNGEAAIATAVVVTPKGKPPENGRTVLAWGHPTTGTALDCAPSLDTNPLGGIEGLTMMLDRGYTVVATDYVGMGTEGPGSYLVGVTEGNSVLDAVRAAHELDGTEAGDSVILWGHSQGGQAVLFAAERARDYAPELDIRAVAVAAPAADLSALMQNHLHDISGVTIGSYAFQAYSEVYKDRGAELDGVLTSVAQQILPKVNDLCLLKSLKEIHAIGEPVVGDFFAEDPTTKEPWATLLRENSAGAHAFDAPLFIAQGLRDELVVPADTEAFADHERASGMDVTFHPIKLADHSTIAYLALPSLWEWLDSKDL